MSLDICGSLDRAYNNEITKLGINSSSFGNKMFLNDEEDSL